ncbi:MAG: hypothetical protein ACTJH9_05050 [Pseudoalteromonas sp.]|uniref:hypothetical protein n=1 Tax=unclassified Pseudoalteromonas TaxID=194690 RepID=UPI003F95ACEC
MSDKLTDHDIASLYKRGATEQPSNQLDAKVLQSATDAVNTKDIESFTAIEPKRKHKRFYQTWYGQLSTAASLVLIAVLYMKNTTQHPQSLKVVNKPQLLSDTKPEAAPDASFEMMEQADISEKVQSFERNSSSKEADKQSKKYSITARSQFSLGLERITSEVAKEFKSIDIHLAKGEVGEAKAQLKDLLKVYPELEAHLSKQYRELLGNTN